MVIPAGVYPVTMTYGNLTAYPRSGTYGDILNSTFIGADAAQKQALWGSFLWSKGLAIAPGNDSLASELIAYIVNFSQYFPKAPTTFPTSGSYGSVLQAYYGNRSDEEKESIWQSFLSSEGITTTPTDDSKLADFVKMISSEYGASSQQTLSPQEIAKRQLMLQTFNTVLQMLNTIQDTVSVQSANVVFYSQWQEQYTKMLTETPVYVADPTNTWSVSTTDPTRFTFGYDNISVDDIAGYMANTQVNSSNANASFVLNTPTFNTISSVSYTFQVVNGVPSILIKGTGFGIINASSGVPISGPISVSATVPVTVPSPSTFAADKSAWDTAITNAITQPPSPFTYSATSGMGFSHSYPIFAIGFPSPPPTATESFTAGPLVILWRDVEPYPNPASGTGTVDSSQSKANTDTSEKRSELNSLLQQDLENTRSRRKTIQASASTAQTHLSATKDSISNQADLMTSILQTMNSLISSILR